MPPDRPTLIRGSALFGGGAEVLTINATTEVPITAVMVGKF